MLLVIEIYQPKPAKMNDWPKFGRYIERAVLAIYTTISLPGKAMILMLPWGIAQETGYFLPRSLG